MYLNSVFVKAIRYHKVFPLCISLQSITYQFLSVEKKTSALLCIPYHYTCNINTTKQLLYNISVYIILIIIQYIYINIISLS